MHSAKAQTPHILIIDDDSDQIRLLVAALRNTAYRVSVAFNGDQGYARAAVLLPDLILLDVRMPGCSGITIAHLLKTNPATWHIPVLFLSALAGEGDRLKGLRAGAVDYISKPFYVDEILERIRIHLKLSQMSRDSANEADEKSLACSLHDPDKPLSADTMMAQVAAKFITDSIDDPSLKSSTVASNLGISIRQLNLIFEAAYGVSSFEFMRRERMRRAALMLGQTNLTIAEVSIEVGYLNSANFATEFKKFWGKSPTHLRRESQANYKNLEQLISEKFAE